VTQSGWVVWQGLLVEEGTIPLRVQVPGGDIRQQLIAECHDGALAGHLGRDKTLQLLQRQHSWVGMHTQVAEYVRSCHACQVNKPSTQLPYGLLHPLDIPAGPWDSVSLDLTFLPLTSSGKDCCVVFVDRFTKFVRIVPCSRTITAPGVAQLYVTHVLRHGFGVPRELVSDRDPRFTGHFWGELQRLMGTKLSMSSAFHPQSDGQTERANRTFKEMLRSYVASRPGSWCQHLDMLEFAYNNSVHPATGFSPFFMNYGRDPRTPTTLDHPAADSKSEAAEQLCLRLQQVHTQARAALLTAQGRMEKNQNLHRRQHPFVLGSQVLVSTANFGVGKLMPRFLGPCTVTSVINDSAVQVLLPAQYRERHNTFHVSLLKPYLPRPASPAPLPPEPPAPQDPASSTLGPHPAADELQPTTHPPPTPTRRVTRSTSNTPVVLQQLDTVPVIKYDVAVANRPPELFTRQGVKYFTPEAIIGSRVTELGVHKTATRQYQVKWVGYPEYEATWEGADQFREDVPDMVEEYERGG